MSSSLSVRFTSRYESMPRIALLLGKEVISATRYIEYDPITHSGTIWYSVWDRDIRCVHEPLEIAGEQELAQRMLALLQSEMLCPGWSDDLKTCEEAGICSWTETQAMGLEPTHAG